ncbi:hypothetical protein CIG19_20510 [Enterobacterales bacterium CwR94]|nr:hypothetical protein CIG19_20510 [Enterobacterales bacterium CwR94]
MRLFSIKQTRKLIFSVPTLNGMIITQHSMITKGLPFMFKGTANVNLTQYSHMDTVYAQFSADVSLYDIIIIDAEFYLRDDVRGLIEHVVENCRRVPMLILFPSCNEQEALYFRRAGAAGIINKDQPVAEFRRVMRRVLRMNHELRSDDGSLFTPASMTDAEFNTLADLRKLTPGERCVMKYLIRGHSVTEIANLRDRSVKTISSQKQSALKKMGLPKPVFIMTPP